MITSAFVWVVLACSTTNPPPKALPVSPATADPSERFVSNDCVQQCIRQNMARAVAADTIKTDCESSCKPKSDDAALRLNPD